MKQLLSKKSLFTFLCLLILAAIVFIETVSTPMNIDTWYHVALGSVYAHTGPLFHDVFSFSAFNRSTVPHEWLFQIIIYLYINAFGTNSVGFFVAVFSALQIFLFYFLLKKIFSLPGIVTFLLSFLYFAGTIYFDIARPTVIANLLFLLGVFIVLLYVYKNKNYLWLLIPLMILWENLHASFILLLGITFGYAAISYLLFFLYKEKTWLKKGNILFIYTGILFLATFLPPLWGAQYGLLWSYVVYHNLVSQIVEWKPLVAQPGLFACYSVAIIFLLLGLAYKRRREGMKSILLLTPLFFFLITPFLSMRNMLYATLGLVVGYAAVIETVMFYTQKSKKKLLLGITSLIVLFFTLGYTLFNGISLSIYNPFLPAGTNAENYPENAATFILHEHMQGHMFNDYKYGGYLMYRLYPFQKVFIDGRTDPYFCCELPKLTLLNTYAAANNMPAFSKTFYDLINRYDISFVVTTREPTMDPKIIQLLTNNPDWSLVFWDDNAQIFVRHDGKNTKLLQEFAATAATPYSATPYNKQKPDEALFEYKRMAAIADSAKSENIIGLLYLQKHNTTAAMQAFTHAIKVTPTYVPPYLNLIELYIADQKYDAAMEIAKHLSVANPTIPDSYVVIGNIELKIYNNPAAAREIWNQGLQNVGTNEQKQQLQSLLNSIAY